MTKMFGTAATVICTLFALPTISEADGFSAVYTPDGRFIDTIEIVGDVTMPSGETYAVLEMPSEHMRFYVDPDAIYVMLDSNNPILTRRTPFRGFWLDQRTIDNTAWPACPTEAFDEFGAPYQAHGTLVWANTGIAENGYDLQFQIQLGTCDGKPQDWGVSGFAPEGGGTSVNGTTPADDHGYTLTDANGAVFAVNIAPERTTLVPISGAESLAMYANCTAYAAQQGWGSWGWSNGGFIIEFAMAHYSFPRMDAPIENAEACRI